MNKMGIIFDLDGTLLNSIADLGNAMNLVLKRNHFKEHPIVSYQQFVGNGVKKLVERALPQYIDDINEYYEDFVIEYGKNFMDRSVLYDDVYAVLKELNNKSIPIAIHTNKLQLYLDDICDHYFKGIEFVSVLGDKSDLKHKPNPFHTLAIANEMKVDPKNIFFVGDSDVDIKTGLAAGMIPVGVSWGFRSVEELKGEGAQFILNDMKALMNVLELNKIKEP